MFQRKRQLKKEVGKIRVKILSKIITILLAIILIIEFGFFYFYFGRIGIISPVSKITSSKVLEVEKGLDKKNISYSTVNISNDGSYLVNLKNDGVVILSAQKNIASQLSSLQLMLSRLTIEGKKLKSLDFRFNNPVVSF